MQASLLVHNPAQLTSNWAQRVIDTCHPGVIVNATRVLSVTTGTTTRIKMTVAHDGPGHLPRHWFVKLPSHHLRARLITALPRLLQSEVRFYNEIAPDLPIPHPTLMATEHRPWHGAIVILEDVLADGARTTHTGDHLNPDQAQHMIQILARLHAKYLLRPQLHQDYPWLAAPVRHLEDRLGCVLAPSLMRRGLRLATKHVPVTLHGPALAYATRRRQAMAFLGQGPQTLVHHDCHPGNLYWHDNQPGLLDWQLVRIGEGIGDIAYLCATALTTHVRRQIEEPLIAYYAQCLLNEGVQLEQSYNLLQRYRAHLVYPLEAMLVTLAVGGMMDPTDNLALIQRAANAVDDWQSFTAFPY